MTTYACPLCDFENVLQYELDGYKPLEVWLDNDDNGFLCAGCWKKLDPDDVYDAASLDAAGG